MIGVQSCKHFGCQRSQPTILGFGHPSGALEHGARGTILIRGTTFSCRVLTQIVKFEPRSELLEEFCYAPEKKLCNKKKSYP